MPKKLSPKKSSAKSEPKKLKTKASSKKSTPKKVAKSEAQKKEEKRIKKLKKIIAGIPTTPGIYQYFDEKGEIIYIGKAKNLKKRVQQYFYTKSEKDTSPKLIVLVKKIEDINYITVNTETEALLLETNLIKEHRPRYNVLMKDDKSYVYLKFTLSEDYPRIDIVRRMTKNSKDVYMGPYMSATPIRDMLVQLNKLFPFRTCRGEILIREELSDGKQKQKTSDTTTDTPKDAQNPKYIVKNVHIPRVPCLQYHIKRCEAPCLGLVDREEYRVMIRQMISFFKGETGDLAVQLKKEMVEHSTNRAFEKAASARDKLTVLESLSKKQTIVSTSGEDFDVIGVSLVEKKSFVTVFQIRNGKLITSHKFSFSVTNITTEIDCVELFLRDYYQKVSQLPKEICVPYIPDFSSAIQRSLTAVAGHKVSLTKPERGFKKNLLNLAMKNAEIEASNSISVVGKRDAKKAVKELASLLKMKKISHIECYDISHIQGTSKVGSMVVFRDGVPDKSLYKRFKIKTLPEGINDDFASLREVLMRRLEYIRDDLLQKEKTLKSKKSAKVKSVTKKSKGKKQKSTFAQVPDLIILDGGKGQLSTVYDHLKALGLEGKLPIIALAKKEEEIFVPENKESIQLPENNAARLLIQRIRDEAHRFAITYHRAIRSKKMVSSVLDDIKGIGSATKKKLLREFDSVKGIREASDKDLREHVSEKVFKKLREML